MIAACFVIPSQLITALGSRDRYAVFANRDFDWWDAFEQTDGTWGWLDGDAYGAFMLQLLLLPFLGVALTHLVLGWRMGEDRTAGECLRFTLKKTPTIVVIFVLGKLFQTITLYIGTPITMLLAPIVAAEGVGPLTAFRRAFTLGRRRFSSLFSVLVLVLLINLLLATALVALPSTATFLLREWGWIAAFVVGTIGGAVQTVLAVGAAVLAYIDVRNRTEGADIHEQIMMARLRAN